ncbi:MAG: GIY-YIG nuclease family protein [Bacteroidetes bacterium]|nr:GIY-YIG nuclease family protein [Bacteroidota bacterium]MBU1114191.1 GIY-YIG nuclease family protein [Bacteroidota bacterium]MBU1796953.1 GIY-YIG nuclease family protein [Bacteroidota bacterium]
MNISNSGVYVLELFAEKVFSVSINKFKNTVFPKGYYYYIGSAQKNLKSRIERHFKREKNIHWHIDHLTTHQNMKTLASYVIIDAEKHVEAELANNFNNYFNSKIAIEGFGNSDTKETKTHLFYSSYSIPTKLLQKYYPNIKTFLV